MDRTVTRTLYIDGEQIAKTSQPDGVHGNLERLENLAAKQQLHEQPERSGYVADDVADGVLFSLT